MKFTVGNYEIDVKAKFDHDTRNNREATLHFLNELSILYGERAELKTRLNAEDPRDYYTGKHGTIAQARRTSREIFEQLEALGLYD